jgi:hypothetical protein
MSYAYEIENGVIAHCGNITLIPEGANYIEVVQVPDAPRESWVIVDGLLTFDESIKYTVEAKATKDALKLSGIEFEGVFCSAMAEDMWGLNSIQGFIAAGASTPFVFENGNTLVITPTNVVAFTAVWMPFRASFFI